MGDFDQKKFLYTQFQIENDKILGTNMEKFTRGCFLGVSVLASLVATSVEASIVRTVNGLDYEWMELSATVGLSRTDVEAMLIDPSNSLYGFRYASREETELLLRSYSEFPSELNTFYSYMAPGAQAFFDDFGSTFTEYFGQTNQLMTSDNVLIDYNQAINSYFLHGAEDECGIDMSCIGRVYTYALDGVIQAWDPVGRRGADQFHPDPDVVFNTDSNFILGSLLVSNITPVPLPAAAWLFTSGFMGLMLVSRRKKRGK